MPKKTPLDALTIQLDKLTPAELLKARSIIDALFVSESVPFFVALRWPYRGQNDSRLQTGEDLRPLPLESVTGSQLKLLSRYLGKVEEATATEG